MVIGQDSAVVFVRHGGTCVRVHRLRLRKVTHENEEPQIVSEENNQGKRTVDTIEEETNVENAENDPLPALENAEAERPDIGNINKD